MFLYWLPSLSLQFFFFHSPLFSSCRLCSSVSLDAVGNMLYVANVGDSRSVLCRNGAPIALSEDHRPDKPREKERILAAGGQINPVLRTRPAFLCWKEATVPLGSIRAWPGE